LPETNTTVASGTVCGTNDQVPGSNVSDTLPALKEPVSQ